MVMQKSWEERKVFVICAKLNVEGIKGRKRYNKRGKKANSA